MVIEALRAGIPNRAVIRALLPNAPGSARLEGLLTAFRDGLAACASGLAMNQAAEGMLVAGGFGSGKSHFLGVLREEALAQGFVVSIVPISKETQLFDPGRLFTTAVLMAEVPEQMPGANGVTFGETVNDDAVVAVIRSLKTNQTGYDTLVDWVEDPTAELPPFFSALLHLLPHARIDWEKIAAIAGFFGGGQLSPRIVREWLATVGATRRYDTKLPRRRELDRQRIAFFPRLLRAAGYRGWCLLLDELELVGRYSLRQRARSYAELARWLALDGRGVPGCVAIGAITDDFVETVLEARNDRDNAANTLGHGSEETKHALATIEFMKKQSSRNRLRPPQEKELRGCLTQVIRLYHAAYGTATDIELGERRVGSTLREFIKGWITQLDVHRLFQETAEIIHEPPLPGRLRGYGL